MFSYCICHMSNDQWKISKYLCLCVWLRVCVWVCVCVGGCVLMCTVYVPVKCKPMFDFVYGHVCFLYEMTWRVWRLC